MKYVVIITETKNGTIEISAESRKNAEEKALKEAGLISALLSTFDFFFISSIRKLHVHDFSWCHTLLDIVFNV